MSSPEFESIINDAVRGFVEARRRQGAATKPCRLPQTTAQSVRLPLTVRSDADLDELVRCFKLICASEALRERFLGGAIVLDLKLANSPPADKSVPAQAPVTTPSAAPQSATPLALNESVITESGLRQHRCAGQVVTLNPRAVITPAARDYAKTAGIRMERRST